MTTPLLSLLTILCLAGTTAARPVIFGAMGCGPYMEKDEAAAAFYLKQENVEKKSEFLIHLGDLMSGAVGRLLGEPKAFQGLLQSRRELLEKDNKIPTMVLVGDNEWNDVADPAMAYQAWTKTFLGMERGFPNPPKLTMDPKLTSNFHFRLDNVLFLGIQLTGGYLHDPAEWSRRHLGNAAWIKQAMESPSGKDSRATVIFAQANPMIRPKGEPNRFEDFLVPLRATVATYARPVLFLHADGHKWTDDFPWAEKNLRRVQVDLWNTKFPTVQITVEDSGDAKTMFNFNRRLKQPEWLFLRPVGPQAAPASPN